MRKLQKLKYILVTLTISFFAGCGLTSCYAGDNVTISTKNNENTEDFIPSIRESFNEYGNRLITPTNNNGGFETSMDSMGFTYVQDANNKLYLNFSLSAYNKVDDKTLVSCNAKCNGKIYENVKNNPDGNSEIVIAFLKEDQTKPDNDVSNVILIKNMKLYVTNNEYKILGCALTTDEFNFINNIPENIKINVYSKNVSRETLLACYCGGTFDPYFKFKS